MLLYKKKIVEKKVSFIVCHQLLHVVLRHHYLKDSFRQQSHPTTQIGASLHPNEHINIVEIIFRRK